MRFVRENLFLIVVAAIVLLGGGGMVATCFIVSQDIQKAADIRGEMDQTLEDLKGRGSNAAMVTDAEKRVKAIQEAAGKVASLCIEWNRKNLPVLQLQIPESDTTVPAFPIDEQLYRDHGLGYVFTKTYMEATQSLLDSLRPTTPPTEGEIQSQQLQWQNHLMQRKLVEVEKSAPSGGAKPATGLPSSGQPTGVAPAFGPSAGPLIPLPPQDLAAPGASGQPGSPPIADASVEAQAREKGRESAVLMKARRGAIYVDSSALDMVFREEVPNPTNASLWQAQLNLWVTADLLAAINATNEEAFAKAEREGKSRDVLTAAVKRLIRIEVNEDYIPPSAEAVATPTPVRRYSGDEESLEDEKTTRTVTVGGGGVVGGKDSASVLTRRGSSRDYDVLHYTFVVVMPTQYLPALERHLMARNYHTILNVQIRPPESSFLGGGTGEYGTPQATSGFYYYGTEPVVQVEISGELLLLTAWERGTWNARDSKWSEQFPPLIPVEAMMLQYPNQDSPALRPEDASRISRTTGAATNAP
jgi:hypothetical protein